MEPNIVETGPNSDLSHLNLDGCDFSNQDLCYSDFHGSSLQGADFTGSILYGTNFVSTNLRGAVFTGAQLIDPSVPFTDHELSDFLDEGAEIVTDEQDSLRENLSPERIDGYIYVDGPPTGLSGDVAELVDSLFTTGRLFRWPESRHFRAPAMERVPTWFAIDTWTMFCTASDDPYQIYEDGERFFFSAEWMAFERTWIRSYVLHNAATCFAFSEHDRFTVWPGPEQISDYPFFNGPPALVWSSIGISMDDESLCVDSSRAECMICNGEFSTQWNG